MNNLLSDKSLDNIKVFDHRYIEVKSLYLSAFGRLPDVHFINGINGEKAYDNFVMKFSGWIQHTHTYRWYDRRKKKYSFDRTVLVLNNQVVLEFNENYLDILHDNGQTSFVNEVTALANRYRDRVSSKAEVNLVVRDGAYLELKSMEIKRTKLNVDLYYEDDFKPVGELIRKRLNKKADKGIVLLHGLPGTGKTTYLRYLIGKLRKQVLFLSTDVARSLMDPSFLQLIMDNPDSVLIIEDAEHLIMDRRSNSSSSVSNLLNISDGLLSDILNVQLICTFNNALTLVDSALMRKGRLIAQCDFGKLSVAKAQQLSDHLKLNKVIEHPVTLAELTHPQEEQLPEERPQRIGFRRAGILTD